MMRTFKTLFIYCIVSGVFSGLAAFPAFSQESGKHVMTIEEFLQLAGQNDTEFEQILISELALSYQKKITLPAGDLVFSVKQQHEFFLNPDRDSPDTTASLSKLFPFTGTELTADYEVGASISSSEESSSASFAIAQPVAENAFGRSTRLLDKIVGLEVDVASHQIVEAYEDYLAAIITAYYTWHEDYANLLIGRSSYSENLKLLDNMHERQKQKIALPIDVNKVKLQVLVKKERLVELEEQYNNSLNVVERIVRYKGEGNLIPAPPEFITDLKGGFDSAFNQFRKDSRTFSILEKLEEKSSLEVAREADDLFPSIKLIAGYEVSGEKYTLNNEDAFYYAGATLEWPFFDQVDRAEYDVSKINEEKTKLSTVNTYYRLYTQLKNLYLEIQRERELIGITEEKIGLARAVLKDEEENYSFGKVTLNDYIQAVNNLDNNRFDQNTHDALYRKFLVEWMRLTDRLVHKKDLTADIDSLKDRVDGRGSKKNKR